MSGSKSSAPGAGAASAELPSPLGLTVHSMPLPALAEADVAAADPRRTASGRWRMLAVLAVCTAPVVASYFTYFVVRPQSRSNYSELITPPREAPAALPLRTLAGEPVRAATLRGQWLLVLVADARCDARCERHLLLQRQLREALGRDKDRVDKLWLVTGPGTPQPAVLRAIGGGGADAGALSGVAAVTLLRVGEDELTRWLVPADGRRLDDHLYLVDPMGQWMMRTPVDPDPARLKRDLERLLRASASWDTPGR